ncbi:hypothetical protein ScPMuIL_003764 [Solemya velum]
MVDHFHLDQSGDLYLQKEFDREVTRFANLLIWATPQCYQTLSSPKHFTQSASQSSPPPEYKSDNHTLLWTQILIVDENDNPPMFRRKMISKGMTRDTQFGAVIINLQDEVIDRDIGNNSLSTFRSIFLEMKITPEDALGIGEKARDPFIVLPNGTVKTNIYFQSNMFGYFTMRVYAQNVNSDLADDAVLRISLINDDQRVRVIFRRSPEEVRNFTVPFLE